MTSSQQTHWKIFMSVRLEWLETMIRAEAPSRSPAAAHYTAQETTMRVPQWLVEAAASANMPSFCEATA